MGIKAGRGQEGQLEHQRDAHGGRDAGALIIFMVITPMLNNKVNVDLPKATAAVVMEDANKEDSINVAVTRDGKTFLGGDQVTVDDLGAKITDLVWKKTSLADKTVYLRADSTCQLRQGDGHGRWRPRRLASASWPADRETRN
jgi:hypothetical protein